MIINAAKRLGLVAALIVLFSGYANADEKSKHEYWKEKNVFGYGCHKDCKSGIFEGVTQAYIYVHYNGAQSKEEQMALPAPLRKESIEKLLVTMYKERFSSTDCKKHLKGNNPYSCDNQPVTLLSSNEFHSAENRKAIQEPGALTVIFEINVGPTEFVSRDVPWTNLQAVFHMIQKRQDKTLYEIVPPSALAVNQSEKVLQEKLENYITNRLR